MMSSEPPSLGSALWGAQAAIEMPAMCGEDGPPPEILICTVTRARER